MVASDASLSGTAAGSAPTVTDVERIVALADPVIRNLQITQCYCELSRAFAARTGGGPVNWCTFATWASKQAGQTIRREDLARTFERLFGRSREATSVGNAAVASMAELEKRGGPERLWEVLWKALKPTAAFDRASAAVARGNRKVFEEIGREFARFLALPRIGGGIDPAALAAFHDRMRPGDPPAGQGLLRQAFRSYAVAFGESDRKARAELMLLANLTIGWHEQTRLQPEITDALDAPLEEPVKLRRDLLRELLRSRLGIALRLPVELLPGRASPTKNALDELDRARQTDRPRGGHRDADDPFATGRDAEPRRGRAGQLPHQSADDEQPRAGLAAQPDRPHTRYHPRQRRARLVQSQSADPLHR